MLKIQNGLFLSGLLLSGFLSTGCELLDRVEEKATVINHYEKRALILAKDNRELTAKVSSLEYELQTLQAKNQYLQAQLTKEANDQTRKPASISPTANLENDYVKYDTYKWSPTQLLGIAQKEFNQKKFDKSAQYFHTYLSFYDEHKTVDDEILFQSGLAAYQSGLYYDWSVKYFTWLQKDYPTSKYYRGSKLWLALSDLKMGKKDDFYKTVEEFRTKYRNSQEWEILKEHYEELTQKYKK